MPICTVVGAGPRLGSAVARAFAEIDFEIVLVSRNTATTGKIRDDLVAYGARVNLETFDATDRTAAREGFGRILDRSGVPDVVIYNPANMVMSPFSEVSAAEMEKTWPVMLYGPMNVTAAVVPSMRERGSGAIFFTGGGFGIDPSVPRAPHSIAKAALRNYAHGLFLELRDSGVHAGTVTVHRPLEPGDDTDSCASRFVSLYSEAPGEWSWERHFGR